MPPRRKRPDYVPPAVRERQKRPAPPPAPVEPVQYFPPGTWKKVVVGGLVGAFLLAGLAAFVLDRQRGQRAEARETARVLVAGSCETDRRTDLARSKGDGHVASPVFRVDPPAGGDHVEEVAKAGVYAGDRVPDDGRLVHALEHGYVVLWHRPGTDTAPLERIAEEHEGDVIVAERDSLPVPVAATAWERRLLCEEVEPAALDRFVEAYVGEGPEDVSRG